MAVPRFLCVLVPPQSRKEAPLKVAALPPEGKALARKLRAGGAC